MSVFDSIKGAIFEDGPEGQDNTGAPTKPVKPPPIFPDMHPGPYVTQVATPSDLRNMTEFVNFKTRIYPASGPLCVFIATYDSLKAAIPDEATRLSAAIGVCTAQGGSVSGILSDIELANSKLSTEKQNIEVARANKLNGEVAQLEAQAKDLGVLIEAKSKEIGELKFKQESVSDSARIAKTQIESKTKTYMAALSQIAADLDAMERKLKGAK